MEFSADKSDSNSANDISKGFLLVTVRSKVIIYYEYVPNIKYPLNFPFKKQKNPRYEKIIHATRDHFFFLYRPILSID